MLVQAAKVRTCAEWEKCVLLLLDEVYSTLSMRTSSMTSTLGN